jgi:hypothetical protein
MIHIDGNTYIDDTLVTCAEYQLFIDEMRTQGKYYQPDHWSSYQHPAGQAHAPIFGVRFADAKSFCEWLTKRETNEWAFRLPTPTEAEQFMIIETIQAHVGYWTEGSEGETNFAWTSSTPVYIRNVTRGRDLAQDITLDRDLAIELYRALSADHDIDRDMGRDFTSALDSALNLAHQVYLALDRILKSGLNRDLSLKITHKHDLDESLYLASTITRILNLHGASQDVRNRVQYIYLDIDTLHERIAGRSPVFEGIRLVKERVI